MALRFLLALAFTAAWVARAADDDATAAATTVAGRHAHWVLRVSDLERSVDFYEKVFGMRVLRHEENSAACPITCNGNFQSPWSKTMMVRARPPTRDGLRPRRRRRRGAAACHRLRAPPIPAQPPSQRPPPSVGLPH